MIVMTTISTVWYLCWCKGWLGFDPAVFRESADKTCTHSLVLDELLCELPLRVLLEVGTSQNYSSFLSFLKLFGTMFLI